MIVLFADSQNVYPKTIVYKNDTLVAFTPSQTRKIYVLTVERDYYKNVFNDCDTTISKNNFLVDSLNTVFLHSENNYKKIIALQKKDMLGLEEAYEKKLKKERTKTFWGKVKFASIGISFGTLLSIILIH